MFHSLKRESRIALVMGLVSGLIVSVSATNFYVSPTGSDGNNGTSTTTAWQTITKVNNSSFVAGDFLYFQGGQTFAGNVTFTSNDGGNASNRFTVSSYGTGVATINASTGTGISVSGVTGITIQNLKIVGVGFRTSTNNPGSTGNGIIVTRSNNVTIDHVEATGFQLCGVGFGGGTSDIRITNVNAHDNGYAGISTRRAGGSSSRIYIGYCTLHNNAGDRNYSDMSGQGVELGNVSKATIEYCVADSNGWNCAKFNGGGPVGIWCYQSDSVTMQYNISHNNFTAHNQGLMDGGGFDFDDHTYNSVLQYNYSYENDGPGVLLCANSASLGLKNCVVRYNISANDGQYCGWAETVYGTYGYGLHLYGSQNYTNVKIYNNLIYTTNGIPCIMGGSGGPLTGTGVMLWNNIFLMRDAQFPDGTPSMYSYWGFDGTTAQRNVYWCLAGTNPATIYKCYWGTYNTFADFTATGQEKLNGTIVGINRDPKLADVRNYPRLTDPTQLANLTQFKLLASSPCIDSGLNLSTLFSVNPGTHDFYNVSLPQGSGYDIGASEYTGITSIKHGFLPVKNNFTMPLSGQVKVYSILGQIVGAYNVAKVKAFSVPELSKGNYLAVYPDGKVMKTEK